ncbi:hypothetical protein D3C87_1595590 [compost metagenome]
MSEQPSDLIVEPLAVPVESFSVNTAQRLIYITEDRLQLRLQDYQNDLEKRRDWLTPMGIFLTIISTLSTATFNDVWSIKASTIEMVFMASAIVTGLWTARSLVERFKTKGISIQQFIERLRSERG